MRLRPILMLLVLTAAALAGCAADDDALPRREPEPPEATRVIETPLGCGGFCEPSVAVDGDGWIFVYSSAAIARSPDGEAWETIPLPPYPPTAAALGAAAFRTDNMLQVAPDGTLWYSGLVAMFDFVTGSILLYGVQVASSTDHGDTWRTNAFLNPIDLQPTLALGSDRQWLGLGPDGDVYVVFQRIPFPYSFTNTLPNQNLVPGIWASHSSDGEAFSALVEVTPGAQQGDSYVIGAPLVTADALHVPFHFYPSGGDPELLIATSTDQAQTFTHRGTGTAGSFFPALDADGDAWSIAYYRGRTLQVVTSDDAGDTWSQPRNVSASGVMVSSPWAHYRDGAFEISWLSSEDLDSGLYDLHWTRLDGTGTDTVIATGLGGSLGVRANTDFAHHTYRDGLPILVAGDATSDAVRLYALPA